MIKGYFDGCCEPVNPGGVAAYGAVIFKDSIRIWEKSQIYHPDPDKERKTTSNNLAEYSGLLAILEFLLMQGWNEEPIEILGDSQLVIRQMNGQWRIKQGFYVPIALQCRKLLAKFPRLRLKWIPRTENHIADELSKAKLLAAGVKFKIQKEG